MPSGATTRAHVRSPGSEPPPPPERRRTTTSTTTTEEAAAAVEGVDGGACDWRALLRKAAGRALGGGVPGAMAMLVQVLALMWLRTLVNYQYRHGVSLPRAAATLYQEGGLRRFYRGLLPALIQAPLSRFGDTAANSGVLALLTSWRRSTRWPLAVKTSLASTAAALWRVLLTPIDTLKTTLQVEGGGALALLSTKVGRHGPLVLYDGCLGAAAATWVGHYPWFTTYNFLNSRLQVPRSTFHKFARNGFIGFTCSIVADTLSNAIRVVKTTKQTSMASTSYVEVVSGIVARDGLASLFFRGLGTRLLTNAIQAILFTVLWKALEEHLNERARRRHVGKP